MVDWIELRCEGGPLLGVIVGGTALLIKKGRHMYEVDWESTLMHGQPVIFARVLHPEGAEDEMGESLAHPAE